MEDARVPNLGRADARPMSPHLGIWRWHITMAGSILHRATGIALYAGALIAAWWAVALALGPGPYQTFLDVSGSWFGRLIMFGLTVSFFYHLGNGVRHLVWDTGRGFALKTSDQSGVAAMVFGVAAAVVVWALALHIGAV